MIKLTENPIGNVPELDARSFQASQADSRYYAAGAYGNNQIGPSDARSEIV